MSKVFQKQRHMAAPSSAGSRDRRVSLRKKSISFDPRRNKVRFVRVPARSQNPDFWFSERRRVVKKGLQFEMDPDISVEINVDSRLQLGAMAYPSNGPSPAGARSGERAYLEVKEVATPLIGGLSDDSDDEGKWLCVGSVPLGGMVKLHVTLPAGMYQLRCTGNRQPLQVFGQAWDVEMELV